MECRDFRLMLVPFADGDLSREERSGVEAHLASCVGCRTVRERLGPQPLIPHVASDPRELSELRAAVLRSVDASCAPTPAPSPRPGVLERTLGWLFRGSIDIPKPFAWGGLALVFTLGILDRDLVPAPVIAPATPPASARVIDEGIDVLALSTLRVN